MSWRNGMLAGGVVGVAAAIAVAGTVINSDSTAVAGAADAAAGEREFLTSQRGACPIVTSTSDQTNWVTASSIPGVPGQNAPGELQVSRVNGKAPRAAVDKPGTTATVSDLNGEQAGLFVAEGGMAPGAIATGGSWDLKAESKGVATAPCLPAEAESWLLGGGAGEGQRDVLQLVNPTATDSVVDLAVFAASGEAELTGNEGIVVPAGGFRAVRLDALAPANTDLAIRVRTRVGLITAYVLDDRMDGLTPRGVDYVLPSREPARTGVITGLPTGPGEREIVLFSPERPGTVQLSLMTAEAEQPLLAEETIELKRDRLKLIDLAAALGGEGGSLRFVSDVPIFASVRAATDPSDAAIQERSARMAAAEVAVEQAQGVAERKAAEAELAKAERSNAIEPGGDLVWLSPSDPLTGQAGATGLRSDLNTTLYVSAVDRDVSAVVSVLPGTDSPADPVEVETVAVKAGTTVPVAVDAPKSADQYSVVVSANGGAIHVAHLQRGPHGAISGFGWGAMPIWVRLPNAQPAYGG